MAHDNRTSVLVAAYNAAGTLEHAVLSALAQPEVAEVCIVDDASSDATGAIARALAEKDARVRFVASASNIGPAAARNTAIAATTSPWLAVLDADDYMLEGRLGALHAIASASDFVGDALIRVKAGQAAAWTPGPLAPRALSLTEFMRGNLGITKAPLDLGFMKPLMRREFLDAHGLRYRPDMRLGEDYELYARALALGARFHVCGPTGYVSVERQGSLSTNHSEEDLQRLRDCDGPIERLRALTPEETQALRQHWNSVDCRLQWRRLIRAVKDGDSGLAFSTFRSWGVTSFLLGKLAEEAWRRATRRTRSSAAAALGEASVR